jgi:hypothetical protein
VTGTKEMAFVVAAIVANDELIELEAQDPDA